MMPEPIKILLETLEGVAAPLGLGLSYCIAKTYVLFWLYKPPNLRMSFNRQIVFLRLLDFLALAALAGAVSVTLIERRTHLLWLLGAWAVHCELVMRFLFLNLEIRRLRVESGDLPWRVARHRVFKRAGLR